MIPLFYLRFKSKYKEIGLWDKWGSELKLYSKSILQVAYH